ncbi:MAG: TIGR03905 family TSCPD domain-containing protein [Oscillospiraceae bacterium]|nr:TIGR03905 family TSCPD domain-containing protein [Oscillospiraceae bacterium]
MTYTYTPRGVCSRRMVVELSDSGVIENVRIDGGCNGNLQGISRLVQGMKAEEAIARMEGISCGGKPTSCPDQLAQALRIALAK